MRKNYISITALLCLITGPAVARADWPPPTPLPKPTSPFAKGHTIEIASFSYFQSATRRQEQGGGTYDTSAYCYAVIDISADPGMVATVTIDGFDDPGPSKYAEFPVETITFSGYGKTTADGTVVETHIVPLLHNETSFGVRLSNDSARAPHGDLHVFMTPLPCGYNPQLPPSKPEK